MRYFFLSLHSGKMKTFLHIAGSQISSLESLWLTNVTQCNINARKSSEKLILYLTAFYCSWCEGHKPSTSITLLSDVLYKECSYKLLLGVIRNELDGKNTGMHHKDK